MELTPIDDVIEYMIWVVEITSREFFNGDKGAAYRAMLDIILPIMILLTQ